MKKFKSSICLLLVAFILSGTIVTNVNATEESSKKIYAEVPLYFQTDYPDTPYGNGTVETSGCGITSLAMVATYLTEEEYLPDELAERFGKYNASNMERMEYASRQLEIPSYDKVYNWDEAMMALKDGAVVIAMMGETSLFTESQHFIVLTGINEDGKVMVNDPNKDNYSKSELVAGFENGFEESLVSIGFSGGWIYKKPTNKTYLEGNAAAKQEIEDFSKVPVYFQNDYPYDRYGTGTIAKNGCSATSMAMVASYMTEHQYMPDEIADFVVEFNGNMIERLEYAADLLQLKWKKSPNFHVTMNALREGQVAIVLMNSKSIFTTGQHFIVLTGVNEDGKVMVNDPNRDNYSLWNLENGFEEGFEDGDILCGYDGAWIFDKNAMPENPFIYVKPKPEVESRYPEWEFDDDELNLLARIIWLEARGESFEGQQAIAEIVFNRMVSHNYPDTIKDVIMAEGQFSTVKFLSKADPAAIQYEAIEKALSGPNVLPMNVTYFGRKPANENVWDRIGGHVFCYDLGCEADAGG